LRPSLSNSVDVITTSSGINLINSFGVYRSSEKTRKIVSKLATPQFSGSPDRARALTDRGGAGGG
jgi:hypothetical protein